MGIFCLLSKELVANNTVWVQLNTHCHTLCLYTLPQGTIISKRCQVFTVVLLILFKDFKDALSSEFDK